MRPKVTVFISRTCPVCFRVLHLLRVMEIDGKIRLISVDINANTENDLMDKYHFFVRRVLGGVRQVPVILLEDSLWFIPTVTSTGKEAPFKEKIEEAVKNLEKQLEKALSWREPVFPPTHSDMIFGWSPWHASSF